MFRLHANAARASLWLDTFPKVMRLRFPGAKWTPHRQDGFIEMPGGSELWIGGLDAASPPYGPQNSRSPGAGEGRDGVSRQGRPTPGPASAFEAAQPGAMTSVLLKEHMM